MIEKTKRVLNEIGDHFAGILYGIFLITPIISLFSLLLYFLVFAIVVKFNWRCNYTDNLMHCLLSDYADNAFNADWMTLTTIMSGGIIGYLGSKLLKGEKL